MSSREWSCRFDGSELEVCVDVDDVIDLDTFAYEELGEAIVEALGEGTDEYGELPGRVRVEGSLQVRQIEDSE